MRRTDPYVYPDTNILINKFDCHDADVLNKLEALSSAGNLAYLQLHPIEGEFDFEHLKEIHRFIFQDVFDWAGKVRTVDIGKGNLFCRTMFIDEYATTIFSGFYESCFENRIDKSVFVRTLAARYADLNALHPFREGNGRSQREFIRELCLKCGYVLDLTSTKHQEMLDASVLSFNKGDISRFVDIFMRCIIPVKDYKKLQKKLGSDLLILSPDD